MGLYQKHHLQSAYDLTHCRTLFKKYEELDLAYEYKLFFHPRQYFIRWNDDHTFWFKVLKYTGGRAIGTHYNTRYKFLVEISGTDKKPVFTIQRKLGYYDWASMALFGGIALIFAYIFLTLPTVNRQSVFFGGLVVLIFFSVAFFPLVGEPGYEVFKDLIKSEEISAE